MARTWMMMTLAALVLLFAVSGALSAGCTVNFSFYGNRDCSGSAVVSKAVSGGDTPCTYNEGDDDSISINCDDKVVMYYAGNIYCNGTAVEMTNGGCTPYQAQYSMRASFGASSRLTNWVSFFSDLFAF